MRPHEKEKYRIMDNTRTHKLEISHLFLHFIDDIDILDKILKYTKTIKITNSRTKLSLSNQSIFIFSTDLLQKFLTK